MNGLFNPIFSAYKDEFSEQVSNTEGASKKEIYPLESTSNRNILCIGQEVTVTDEYSDIDYYVMDGEAVFRKVSREFRAIVQEIFIEPIDEDENYLCEAFTQPRGVNLACFSIDSNWRLSIKTKAGNYYSFLNISTKQTKQNSLLEWEQSFRC